MSRRIITKAISTSNQPIATIQSTSPPKLDTFKDKLIKYIPAEVVAAWISAKGIVESSFESDPKLAQTLWIVAIVGLFASFFYTIKITAVSGYKHAYVQATISSIAFSIWVIATGPPFEMEPVYGSLLLIGFTLLIPLVNPD